MNIRTRSVLPPTANTTANTAVRATDETDASAAPDRAANRATTPPGPVPDWKAAHRPSIQRSLARALAQPSGGWYVLGPSRHLSGRTNRARIATVAAVALRPDALSQRIGGVRHRHVVTGIELVSWVANGRVAVAPAQCPHLGAHLADGRVDSAGRIVCPWHGLALPSTIDARVDGQGHWSPLPVFDDGVLVWVRLDNGQDDLLARPVLTARPQRFFDAVIRREMVCEPADILANRLDPWHGVHFHPYAFAHLEVLSASDHALDLRVAYRITPRRQVEVDARFHCPDPRTIVMTITAGEGTGSVIETHATPVLLAEPGRAPLTAMTEATLATSDRPGFVQFLKAASVARPVLAALAGRLWRDDAAYAERLYTVRTRRAPSNGSYRNVAPGAGTTPNSGATTNQRLP